MRIELTSLACVWLINSNCILKWPCIYLQNYPKSRQWPKGMETEFGVTWGKWTWLQDYVFTGFGCLKICVKLVGSAKQKYDRCLRKCQSTDWVKNITLPDMEDLNVQNRPLVHIWHEILHSVERLLKTDRFNLTVDMLSVKHISEIIIANWYVHCQSLVTK